jgi:hypothetical protein
MGGNVRPPCGTQGSQRACAGSAKKFTQGEIGLGEWVKNHRKYRMKGTLLADKEARLEEIGFVWQVRTHNS